MRFFILVLCGLCASATAAEKLNSVVAIVNNESISRLEIDRRAEELRRLAAAEGRAVSEEEIRREVLEALIFRLLQLQESRRLGGRVPDSMAEQRLAELRAEWGIAGEEDMRAAVREKTGMDLDEFRVRMREDMEIEALFYREVYSKVDVYDEEIEHFLRTESDFVGGREYRLRHILIPAAEDGRARAEEIRNRAVGGESFAELAREYSAGDNAANGGDLEWRGAAQLPAPFVAAAQNMKPGEISDIIPTGRGFHLLFLEDARGGVFDGNARRLRIAHIFLPPDADALADEIYQRLQDGADFAALAAQYSTDERSAANGGDLGWFIDGALPDYFAPLKNVEAGATAAPLKSPFGLHVVRVVEADEVDMEEARGRARELLRERRALSQRLDWLNRLRNRAYVVIIDPEFGTLIDGGNAAQ